MLRYILPLAPELLSPTSGRVTSTTTQQHILAEMWRLWGCSPNTDVYHAPENNPVTLGKSHLAGIIANPHEYMCSYKSDGIAYWLVLTTLTDTDTVSTRPIAALVTRSGQVFEIKASAMSHYFTKGCLFLGEIVYHHTSHRCVYELYDAVSICGQDTYVEHTFAQRHAWLHQHIIHVAPVQLQSTTLNQNLSMATIHSMYAAKQHIVFTDTLRVVVKDFVPLLTTVRASLDDGYHPQPVDTDGYIIVHAHMRPLTPGMQLGCFKCKDFNTIDFEIDGHLRLYYRDREHLVDASKATSTIPVSFKLIDSPDTHSMCAFITQEARKYLTYTHTWVVECVCLGCATLPVWDCSVLRMRPDKKYANSIVTIASIVTSIRDHVCFDDIKNALGSQHVHVAASS